MHVQSYVRKLRCPANLRDALGCVKSHLLCSGHGSVCASETQFCESNRKATWLIMCWIEPPDDTHQRQGPLVDSEAVTYPPSGPCWAYPPASSGKDIFRSRAPCDQTQLLPKINGCVVKAPLLFSAYKHGLFSGSLSWLCLSCQPINAIKHFNLRTAPLAAETRKLTKQPDNSIRHRLIAPTPDPRASFRGAKGLISYRQAHHRKKPWNPW